MELLKEISKALAIGQNDKGVQSDKRGRGFHRRKGRSRPPNHSIGFIFQSYHLIPHQTILQNVELSLLIAGVSKEERRQSFNVN